MCSNPADFETAERFNKSVSFEELILRFQKIDPREKEIYLTGGEPTLHPQFFELLTILRKRCPGAKFIIDTNARMLFYRDFLEECLNYGKIEFQVSLCGHTAFLHDKITRTKGSFNQTVGGIKNLLSLRSKKNEVEIRVVIHKLTLPHLNDVYDFVFGDFFQPYSKKSISGIERLIFIFMEMEGRAGDNIKEVGITHTQAKPYLEELFSKIKNAPFEIRLYHFPLCALSPKLWSFIWRTLPEREITFLPQCQTCSFQKHCLGIHKDYLKYIGDKEFQPIKEQIKIKETNNFYHPIAKAI